MGCGCLRLYLLTLARPVLLCPPLPPPSPLAVPMGLLMMAQEVQEEQAMLLAPRGLGRGRSCSVSGWTCAGRRAPLRLAQRACTSLRKKLWRCAM